MRQRICEEGKMEEGGQPLSTKSSVPKPKRSIGISILFSTAVTAFGFAILLGYLVWKWERITSGHWMELLVLFSLLLLFTGLLIFSYTFIRERIYRPLAAILEHVDQVAGGNLKVAPLKITQKDEIGNISSSFNIMVSNLKETVDQLNLTSKRTWNVLNNTGQGLLTFNENTMIHEEYSSECDRIFGRKIHGIPFPLLLYPDDEEQRGFIYKLIPKIMEESNHAKMQLYVTLLPAELLIQQKVIHLEYKVIDYSIPKSKQIMVILTDITRQRELEKNVDDERKMLKMVVKVVTHLEDFAELINDYHYFVNIQLPSLVKPSNSIANAVAEIMRHIHTFKGNFSQLGMYGLVRELHLLEERLIEFRFDGREQRWVEFQTYFKTNAMLDWLETEINSLRGILGVSFFENQLGVRVDRSQLIDLENVVLKICPPYEARILVAEIRKLMFKPFRDLLANYIEYVNDLAVRLQKPIHPLVIEGGEIAVDVDFYQNFVKSLIHLFRNMIDHGIDSFDERTAAGKDELGHVKCEITFANQSIHLRISDDGRGIDPNLIRKQLTKRGHLSAEQLDGMNDVEIIQHIFDDGFSTVQDITDLSGRGVGLAALKHEIDRLGGSIGVRSEVQRGTIFEIILPIISRDQMPEVSMDRFMVPLLENAVDLLKRHFGLVMELQSLKNLHSNQLDLSEITSFLNVRGIFEGTFIYSINRDLAKEQVRSYCLGEVGDDEIDELIDDVVAECLNVIIGQSFKLFSSVEELIRMETPVTLHSNHSRIMYHSNEIWSAALKSPVGEIQLSFVLLNDYSA